LNTLRQKLSYIWDYYKFPLIGIPLGILFLIYVISAFTGTKDVPFSVYFINQDVSIESCRDLEAKLLAARALADVTEDIYVDASLIINPKAPDFDSQISFTASISGHTIDIMVSDRSFLEYYAKMDALADLSVVLPADLYDLLMPYLIMEENKGGLMTPYAIDLSDCTYFTDYNLNAPVLTIAKYSEHQEACIAFLRLVFSE